MKIDSNRREFLRSASLAGAALVAGGGALAATGCGNKDKEELERVKKELADEKAKSAALHHQVEVTDDGRLLIHDAEIRQKLGPLHDSQNKPDPTTPTPRKGIRVEFSYDVPATSGGTEERKVNSLCNC